MEKESSFYSNLNKKEIPLYGSLLILWTLNQPLRASLGERKPKGNEGHRILLLFKLNKKGILSSSIPSGFVASKC
jgi:hypothetical protein